MICTKGATHPCLNRLICTIILNKLLILSCRVEQGAGGGVGGAAAQQRGRGGALAGGAQDRAHAARPGLLLRSPGGPQPPLPDRRLRGAARLPHRRRPPRAHLRPTPG